MKKKKVMIQKLKVKFKQYQQFQKKVIIRFL